MSIKVNQAKERSNVPSFEPKTLVKSIAANGNIYLVIGRGVTDEQFAGVRLDGMGTFGYQDNLIREFVVPFNGEVVISND